MDPLKSWAIVGVVGLGAAYYYSQSGKSKRGRGHAPPLLSGEQSQRRASDQRNDSKDKRKKKGKLSDTSDQPGSDVAEVSSASVQTSTNGTVKKRKGGKKLPSKLAQSSAVEASREQIVGAGNDIAEDESIANAEFARQLSGLKTGTSLKKPATQNENKQTRKQGKRNEVPPRAMNGSALKSNGLANSQDMSTASSTTGADADDDLSPAMSPDLRATQATIPSSTDVSDMLEPAPKGPLIFRITEPVNLQSNRQPKSQKAAPETETKKQRQNRQKNEEKKAMREQAEKERRALLEKQLRSAREAEGRPAKNGLGPSQLPSTNAWNKPASAATDFTGPATKKSSASLLDTFEDAPTAFKPRSTNGGANGMSVDKKAWNDDLPSEEEQMRMITEMDSDNGWSTVAKGGKGKKKSSAATTAEKDTIKSSENQKKDTLSTTAASLATFADNNKTNSKGNNNHTSSTMPATSAEHDNSTSSGAEKKESTGVMAAKEEDVKKTATSQANDRNNEESASSEATDAQEPKHVKATYETIDHSVWTRENITQHPDYDPDLPYALTGHPDDDEWAVC